jgi:hypothetical protein
MQEYNMGLFAKKKPGVVEKPKVKEVIFPKFIFGDLVFLIENNYIVQKNVVGVCLDKNVFRYYFDQDFGEVRWSHKWIDENKVFKSKEDLIASL